MKYHMSSDENGARLDVEKLISFNATENNLEKQKL